MGTRLRRAFAAALPIMLGYVSIGIPCGILESQVGMAPWMCLVMSYVYYTGAGQFMIPNLWMAGTPLLSIIASTSFVNTRQILYSAAFSPYFGNENPLLSFFFAASVTDESFGVNLDRFEHDETWDGATATMVNYLSCSSWAFSNFAGALVGEALDVPTNLAAFAMTAIFVCLLVARDFSPRVTAVVLVAGVSVYLCKMLGLGGASILVGALAGVAVRVATRGRGDAA